MGVTKGDFFLEVHMKFFSELFDRDVLVVILFCIGEGCQISVRCQFNCLKLGIDIKDFLMSDKSFKTASKSREALVYLATLSANCCIPLISTPFKKMLLVFCSVIKSRVLNMCNENIFAGKCLCYEC